MAEIYLPDPSIVPQKEFNRQVYRKLTQSAAIPTSLINGISSAADLTGLQAAIDALASQVEGFTTLDELIARINSLSLTDLLDFKYAGRETGFTFEISGLGFIVEQMGSWDMDASVDPDDVLNWLNLAITTSALDQAAFIYYNGRIQQDGTTNTSYYNFHEGGNVAVQTDGTVLTHRLVGGTFDNNNFDDTSINRGYHFIIYLVDGGVFTL